jgi:hypothetical protein
MAHQETPNRPNIQDMSIEEKWDRLHDFFTMDHAISYQTHKRMGTVQEWVDDTVVQAGATTGSPAWPYRTGCTDRYCWRIVAASPRSW